MASLLWVLLYQPVAASQESVETIDRTFTVEGTPDIYVRNVDGRIEVTAHQGSDVRIRAIKEVRRASSDSEAKREADKVKVRIEQVGSRIEVVAQYPNKWFGDPRAVVHFEVSSPSRANLEAESVDGRLEVAGLQGDLRLSTVDGDLRAEGCSGSVVAEVIDGDMLLRQLEGTADVRTVDGDLQIKGKLAAVRAKSTDGDIVIQVDPGSTMIEDWSIRTTDGSIRLELPDGFGADLDIEADDGNIETDHPMTLEGKLSNHRLQGRLYGGGHELRIRTKDGSVELVKRSDSIQ